MVDCGRTSATSRLSTMPSPPSTRPRDARERRSSAFIREDSGIACSMSRAGNCLDNALADSFFHSLKTEWLYHFTLYSRAQARSRVFEYIEGFYNRTRLHSALGYRSPEQYEKLVVT